MSDYIPEGFYFRDDLDGGRLIKKRDEPMKITGVRLGRNATHAIVSVEMNGMWIELIREPLLSQFDHIVNESGIKKARSEAIERQSINDLMNSGGIVDAP